MSVKLPVYNHKGETVRDVALADKAFNRPANPVLVHQAMVAMLANKRRVLADTKDRSEVSGGGRKPWRQKGTGRARHGSIRSPLWVGGGVTFGPTKERNFKKNINRKMLQAAVVMALSDKCRSKRLVIVDEFRLAEQKTKEAAGLIAVLLDKAFGGGETKPEKKKGKKKAAKVLVISDEKNEGLKIAARNLAGVKVINRGNLNLLDLLGHEYLLLAEKAALALSDHYGK